MKKGIHPNYVEITATCSCGNVIKTHSTVGHDLEPGRVRQIATRSSLVKQRVVDTGGRVERFNKRFQHPWQQISYRQKKKRRRALFFVCVNQN
ncbi:LSU ribosomal protein L31p / LSU ribosomalprotein L31p zinc-dependent [Salmonella enterica subsp. arizonae]|uniref:50S ribosomal protein L31 n=1 Tax=Salmonella enterica subsp. arizonae TaxID=59203 RepID=A0A2X4TL81_SALER|nr:LSU ribosomal protein L31p / LSU ribosomalprotein L31p zinc-dependent [Salmonella enterica subsp. arizonae]